MTRELYNKAAAEGKNPMHYIYEDLGINKDCKYFVETGTHLGGSVDVALELGFEKVLSCEFLKDRFDYCMNKFRDDDNVYLWHGSSISCFPVMMSEIDQKSLFWLDAHAEGGGVPTLEELDFISELPIKNHSILIDDVPVYFSETKQQLKDKILSINPDYTIVEYQTINDHKDYVIGAYIE
tara:strand:- start:792 stop:1334 length:543 start_codon:yes stop_codon:yes gene_type:complete